MTYQDSFIHAGISTGEVLILSALAVAAVIFAISSGMASSRRSWPLLFSWYLLLD